MTLAHMNRNNSIRALIVFGSTHRGRNVHRTSYSGSGMVEYSFV